MSVRQIQVTENNDLRTDMQPLVNAKKRIACHSHTSTKHIFSHMVILVYIFLYRQNYKYGQTNVNILTNQPILPLSLAF